MNGKTYGIFGLGKKRQGEPRRAFLDSSNVTQFIAVVVIGIVLTSIVAGIVGIWVESVAKVQQQIGMGLLVLVILVAALIPFMLVRRQFVGFGARDFVFIMLAVGMLIFLLVVTPGLFNLPEIFTVAQLDLVQTTQSMLGSP